MHRRHGEGRRHPGPSGEAGYALHRDQRLRQAPLDDPLHGHRGRTRTEFTFVAKAVGLNVSLWSYRFEALDFGQATKVTETWIDQRSWLMPPSAPGSAASTTGSHTTASR